MDALVISEEDKEVLKSFNPNIEKFFEGKLGDLLIELTDMMDETLNEVDEEATETTYILEAIYDRIYEDN